MTGEVVPEAIRVVLADPEHDTFTFLNPSPPEVTPQGQLVLRDNEGRLRHIIAANAWESFTVLYNDDPEAH